MFFPSLSVSPFQELCVIIRFNDGSFYWAKALFYKNRRNLKQAYKREAIKFGVNPNDGSSSSMSTLAARVDAILRNIPVSMSKEKSL